jgi:endonuclease/exonuclease/phosphatase (EEP) superfamily protein YafD
MIPLSKVIIPHENKKLTIFGAHPLAPLNFYLWKWRNEYTLELAEKLSQTDGPVIVTGDLNNTPWTHYFKQFIKRSGLLDASQGRGPLPTWPAGLAVLPLDHCLHSKEVVIKKRQRGPDIGSDHYPLIIEAEY